MAVTIWKYPLVITDEQVLNVPLGFRPLWVGVQNGQVMLWAEVGTQSDVIEPDLRANRQRRVRIIGTGNRMPNMAGFKYVGTVEQAPFIWHVYAEEA